MKSICILDEKTNDTALTRLAQKLKAVLGSRVALMTDGSAAALSFAEKLTNGFVQGGGTVLSLPDGFESRVIAAARQLETDGAVWLSGGTACRMSVYGANGRPLTGEEEEQIARAVPVVLSEPGRVVTLSCDDAYVALARKTGESFENVAASFDSPEPSLQRFVRWVAFSLGAVERPAPRFFISRSGLTAAARDEQGGFYTHDMLLNLCCACELAEKAELTVPFSSSLALAAPARLSGAVLRYRPTGGDEPWQTDGVMLALRVLRNLSKRGQSLAALYGSFAFPRERRTILTFDGSLDRLADRIPCDEAVTQADALLFLKRRNAGAVLTRQRDGRRCTLEVQACDAETANELCEELERAILTFSDK